MKPDEIYLRYQAYQHLLTEGYTSEDAREMISEGKWDRAKALGALALGSTGLLGGNAAHASSAMDRDADLQMAQSIEDKGRGINWQSIEDKSRGINWGKKNIRTGKKDMLPSGGSIIFTGSDFGMTHDEYLELIDQYKRSLSQFNGFRDMIKMASEDAQNASIEDQVKRAHAKGMFKGMEIEDAMERAGVLDKNLSELDDMMEKAVREMIQFLTSLDRAGYIDWSK